MKFRIPYWLSNNGDGSASVVLERTIEEAHIMCDSQDEGWGENSAGYIEIDVTNTDRMLVTYQVSVVTDDYSYKTETVPAAQVGG